MLADSLAANGSERVARGRLRDLHRAAAIFGFHLAPLDMRQHSGVHEQVVAELFALGARRERLCRLAGRRNAAPGCLRN